MSDSTTNKFLERLQDVRADLQRQRGKLARTERKIEQLEEQEKMLCGSLELVGETVPGTDQSAVTSSIARRRGGKLRAIDAVLEVFRAGETLTKQEVSGRIKAAEIDFHSKNMVNAVATAMNRSPQFRNLGGGVFSRPDRVELVRPKADEEEDAGTQRLLS